MLQHTGPVHRIGHGVAQKGQKIGRRVAHADLQCIFVQGADAQFVQWQVAGKHLGGICNRQQDMGVI